MSGRVTQKEIARKAGVDASTVSLALAGHPRIPESTRAHIRQVAAELGYRPDPALSSIAAARWQGRRDAKGTALAFLADDLKTAEIELKLYLEGVRQQAGLLGYGIEARMASRGRIHVFSALDDIDALRNCDPEAVVTIS